MGGVIQFPTPQQTNIIPPPPQIPEQNDGGELVYLQEEKTRKGYQKLRKKYELIVKLIDTSPENNIQRKVTEATRDLVIDMAARDLNESREEAAKHVDTRQMINLAEGGFFTEEEYLALGTLSDEDVDRKLEEAYAWAKEKFGHAYPAAAPTMFSRPKTFQAPSKKSESKTPEKTLIDKIRETLKKLF